MKSQELRQAFIQFFSSHGHKELPSSSLVPSNDPTLLFTNSGMVQFKDYFTGAAKPIHSRAVTVQKCMRAGGKHNDLDNVGFTPRHHTFFEMLGNFSFGDYFKKDAIHFAWSFLTSELKIPKEKLLVTVHESDEEAKSIWHNQEGVPLNRIFKMGDKDNFWEMGDYGPCGPCSEIFYDHGEKYTDGNYDPNFPLKDEGRFIEIWNLVFMQYERTKDGLTPLPKPSVDTGAGFERLLAAMQGVYWNYDTDLFQPIFATLEHISHLSYSPNTPAAKLNSMRVVADHIRTSTMLISEGVMPSNEGRGYVLRRIIRRAIRHLAELNIKTESFYKIVPAVFESLGTSYPENMANAQLVEKTLLSEEKSFRETLNSGLKLINEEFDLMEKSKSKEFKCDVAFKLYDTFGFPIDLTEILIKEKNYNLNYEKFKQLMNEQRIRSKGSSKFKNPLPDNKIFYASKEKYGKTKFLGYETIEHVAKLLDIISTEEFDHLVFDQTPFYAESGGQTSDHGTIVQTNNSLIIDVIDVQKPIADFWIHSVDKNSQFKIGETYTLKVNQSSRDQIAANHSATHLLQSALIKVCGAHVKQAGSLVTMDKLRFDFTHPEALTKDQIQEVETLVNDNINAKLIVTTTNMKKDQALKLGAMALFGETYGEEVRVISMEKTSIELCGGTHVKNTQEIKLFKMTMETSLSAGIRRIEAVTNQGAHHYFLERSSLLQNLERTLSTPAQNLQAKIETLLQDQKLLHREIDELKKQIQEKNSEGLFANPLKCKNADFYLLENPKGIDNPKIISDQFVEKFPQKSILLFLLSEDEEKSNFTLRTHKLNSDLNLQAFIKLQKFSTMKAGGRADMIQGSISKAESKLLIETIQKYF